ncbi:MAG: winged helix-turn-helix transcriptional regulator [Candidatus Gastranaerophilaceae bacterium]
MRYKRKLEKEIMCPIEWGLDVFGGKWKSRIICVLHSYKTLRYSKLRQELTNISDAVLADMLKELINDGLVERIQYNEIPPKVEYLLTEKGESVLPILQSICNWSKENSVEELDKKLPTCRTCNQLKSHTNKIISN